MSSSAPSSDLLDRFTAIVGEKHAVRDPAEIAPHLVENRGLYHGASPMLLKPGSVEEVSAILKLASETGAAIVPQTGNTGLVGGQTPREGGSDIILSLERMNRVRDIDPVGNTMIVDGGCVLADVHKAAAEHGRMFPLSLGSEGSCRIAGNLSTNAGGTAVLAYGNMRQLCLGLEVVLPTGEIWNGLRRLKKDNTGYDLRDLFIGAEGTLGVITGAVLKLFPQPLGHQVAFAGLQSVDDALTLFKNASSLCGTALTGFELMPRIGVEFTTRHIPGVRDPLETTHPWYVLIDISTSDSAETAERMMTTLLEKGYEDGLVQDATIASSEAQQKAIWHMRESMSDAQKPEGGSIKHDVSVPVAQIPQFMAEAEKAVVAAMPGARVCAFGHMGDGNIHYNISQPVGADKAEFIGRWREINKIVHGLVLQHGGSISAEHGIGQLKRDELASIRSDIEIDLMRRIKTAFDPAGIMNPGKVLNI
ncbi:MULTISPECIES: FAD-binding oxidoreductase [unclassified Rhizobium]|uniref:FAD-binding oxidoreductase n=1 Tax=unclassified Rhizobium TaxID=2613769 RepID=UPI00161E7AAA|nr:MULTISPECIES: FAD-binding oxidoreductase [unclassified Rhizobium]MBB3288549.1 FAD/FMN-containing dehydrogenase [Rhizobium sp. BK252]MBB3403314.1 FAD/FMN-containing dehydrogenase [Rhizobium sp. BK289]MBB3415889.1 FAD/FMN-containing dehydrogenase [Rhizobium sp. BK284]MBB3483777.1 FAD/FMN-containing dehydrogenase [Rhizobium sp. BK347]MDK4722244.1 FAD-binding oxidoreductase [Rhizobium sp. CNPSo 3968]